MCDRKLWGDLDSGGLTCRNDKPHIPGPSTCRYAASEPADRHTGTEPEVDDQ